MTDRCRRTAGLVHVLMAEGDFTAEELSHVGDCPACARVVAEARAFERALAGVGAAVTPHPIGDPTAPLLAHEFHRPKEMSVRIRPSIGLLAALGGAGLAIVSLFILQPPGVDQPTAGASASATPASSAVVVPPPGAPVVAVDEAARILGVSQDEVLLVPNGAVAARREAERVTLVGVSGDRRAIPLTLVGLQSVSGVASDTDTSAVVCATGGFAGDAFILASTHVQGTPSVPSIGARVFVSPMTVDGARTVVAALEASAPRRSWAVTLGQAAGGGTGYGGSFVSMPCDGSDPAVALAAAAQAATDDQALARRAADAARSLVPASDALVGVEACGDVPMARFWAPETPAGGHAVIGGELSVLAPDGSAMAALRASLGLPCRPLATPLVAHDFESVPNVQDRVRSVLGEEHGFQSARQLATVYLGPGTLVVGAHADAFLSTPGDSQAEYVAVVRRSASGDWDAITVRSAEHMDGFAGIGGIRLGVAEGLDGGYAAVYGVPFTIDTVVVELEVGGAAYQYPVGVDGFLAVVPAEPDGTITYRYLARDGHVVESGVVPID